MPLSLPAGYRADPAALADAAQIHALIEACELDLDGRAPTDLSHVVASLSVPGLDPRLDALVVRDTTEARARETSATGASATEPVVAWAWVKFGRRCAVDVHPAHRGRGLGSALLAWAEDRARQFDERELGQTVPDLDEQAAALLRSRGYVPTAHQWLLESTGAEELGEIRTPPGVTIRPFRPEDARPVYELCEDAFAPIQTRRRGYAEWAGVTIGRSVFAPQLSPLAFADGDLVGFLLAFEPPGSAEGFVDQLAVRADQRGRGIAKTLLLTTFRDFHRRGRSTTTLFTHTKTGALPLYEHIGMKVRRSDTIYHGSLYP